ncbi:MAG: hypothetical protein J7647_32250 [Cyanobacteria bacterium SBLK]|nr:hypothetical protein [Cyanobacteria bacterium SBLK]
MISYRDKQLAKEIAKQLQTRIEVKNGQVVVEDKNGKATLDYGQGASNARTRGLF